jgi:hypothetical protein
VTLLDEYLSAEDVEAFIRRDLATPRQLEGLAERGLTLESLDSLGELAGHEEFADGLFDDWNKKLGARVFGFLVVEAAV